jgi:hypothetical protein
LDLILQACLTGKTGYFYNLVGLISELNLKQKYFRNNTYTVFKTLQDRRYQKSKDITPAFALAY